MREAASKTHQRVFQFHGNPASRECGEKMSTLPSGLEHGLVLDGVPIADPEPEQYAAMVSGRDRVTVEVNISKADFDGTKFGPSLVTLLFNLDNPMSFAAAFVAYELQYPCRGAARTRTPLFTTDGVTRWSGGLIDDTL